MSGWLDEEVDGLYTADEKNQGAQLGGWKPGVYRSIEATRKYFKRKEKIDLKSSSI